MFTLHDLRPENSSFSVCFHTGMQKKQPAFLLEYRAGGKCVEVK